MLRRKKFTSNKNITENLLFGRIEKVGENLEGEYRPDKMIVLRHYNYQSPKKISKQLLSCKRILTREILTD